MPPGVRAVDRDPNLTCFKQLLYGPHFHGTDVDPARDNASIAGRLLVTTATLYNVVKPQKDPKPLQPSTSHGLGAYILPERDSKYAVITSAEVSCWLIVCVQVSLAMVSTVTYHHDLAS